MIRARRPEDTADLIALFRNTVRYVNLGDYSSAQVMAWAPDRIDPVEWSRRQDGNRTLVAERDGARVGFAELQDGTHLHMLFVHKDFQGQGIAAALLARVEAIARQGGAKRLTTDASLTARPFFARQGFALVAPQMVSLRGHEFRNFRMEKQL